MTRRAVIYVRSSSETQGTNSSSIEQESDCRRLAEERGLQVVHVYRDVENIGRAISWSNPPAAVQTALLCKPCLKMLPEMNSISF